MPRLYANLPQTAQAIRPALNMARTKKGVAMNDNPEKIRITWDEVNKAESSSSSMATSPIPQPSPSASAKCWQGLTYLKIAVASVVAVAVLAVLVFWRVDAAHRNDPMTTIRVIDSVSSENALVKNKDYFTPKGYGLIQWMISESGQSEGSPMQLSYGPPEVTGNSCQVWGTSGNTRMALRLVKGDRWLFDDIYIATIDGREVDLLATYIRDHPMKTWFKMSWPDLLDSFLQGFFIGLSGGG
jgi:hypothetical protein